MLGSKHTVKFSKRTWHQIKIRERRGLSQGIIQKCTPHERILCAPKFGERSHEESLIQGGCARKAAWDLAKIFTSSRIRDKATFKIPGEVKGMPTPVTSKRPEEREFVVYSGASMHMMSKKELSSGEMGTVESSRTPAVVSTANGEVHTHEVAQRFVHDLNQVITVQLPEEAPRVLSLCKLCKVHGYSYEWVSGQEPRLTKNGQLLICKADSVVPPSCRSRVICQFWKQFVFYNATTRIFGTRVTSSL